MKELVFMEFLLDYFKHAIEYIGVNYLFYVPIQRQFT